MRQTCTKERPYTEGGQWEHPEAVAIEDVCDCCSRYQCPICGLVFKVELPE